MPAGDTHPLIALCYATGTDTRRFPELLEAIHEVAQRSSRTAIATLEPLEHHLDQAAAIAVQMPAPWGLQLEATLREIFGFSDAELNIIAGLLDGESLADIAVRRQRSLHTVRTQMKQLLGRTPCRNQSELLQLVRGLSLVTDHDADTPPSQSTIATQLADGSRLCHYEYGDPHGRPLLVLHTALLGPELPPWIDAIAKQHRLRLLVLARPGYSGSSPAPDDGLNTGLAHSCARIAEWMSLNGLEPLPVLGNVVGAIYAHALAKYHPDRITHVWVCAGPVPLTGLSAERLPVTRRVWLQLIRRKPSMLVPFARLGVGFVRKGHTRRFLQMAYQPPSVDATALAEPGLI
jgi:DNA-binding CsgD family transcriptional regulator